MEAGWWLYSYNRFETTNMTINIEEARKRAFYKQPQTWTRLYMALSVVYTRSSAGFSAIARWRVVTISFAHLVPCSTSLGATSPCTPGRPSAIHYEDNRETKLRATNNVFSEKRVRVCWTWDQSRVDFLHASITIARKSIGQYKLLPTRTRVCVALSALFSSSTACFSAIAWTRVGTISLSILFSSSANLRTTPPFTPRRPTTIH